MPKPEPNSAQLAEVMAMLAGIPLPAFTLDSQERVTAANAAALEILGEQAMGRNLALALRAPDLFDAISALRRDGEQRSLMWRHSNQDHYQATVSSLSQGADFNVLCVLRDTTSEAQHEAMRRDFVANVSHELRTPLTAMLGFIETLQTSAKDDARARERFLAIMANEAGRMNRLVQDLLHLSRVESAERMRPREQIDLLAVLQSAASTVRSAALSHEVTLLLSLPSEPVLLPGDADQLLQVFLNLFENAIKYGARGGEVQISVQHLTSSRGRMVQVDVRDYGEGIDSEHLPRLTERFYRVDSHRSRAEGGTGLGLAIVKHIVNRHRGWLKIDSRRGEGSTFSVSLPLA